MVADILKLPKYVELSRHFGSAKRFSANITRKLSVKSRRPKGVDLYHFDSLADDIMFAYLKNLVTFFYFEK